MKTMSGSVLMLSYHCITSKRTGGFLVFAQMLLDLGFDVDILTVPSHINWFWKRTDRENFANLWTLIKGVSKLQNGRTLRNFSFPLLFPYKLKKLLPFVGDSALLVPWGKPIEEHLKKEYKIIIIESTVGVLLFDFLRDRFPSAKFVYRPSDPLFAYSQVESVINKEFALLDAVDDVWFVNESSKNMFFDRNPFLTIKEAIIISNPLISSNAIVNMPFVLPEKNRKKRAIYIGVFPVDYVLLDLLSRNFPEEEFYIVGPFKDEINRENVFFTGPLEMNQYEDILNQSDVGLVPIVRRGQINDLFELTGKIALYMQHLLPIVAINTSKVFKMEGFFISDNHSDFLKEFNQAIQFDNEKRASLRLPYSKKLEPFTYEEVFQVLEKRILFLV